MWYESEGFGALEELPWPGRQNVIMRQREVRMGEESMWLKILDEDELPWSRRRVGEALWREVSLMEIKPWGVSSVKDGILEGDADVLIGDDVFSFSFCMCGITVNVKELLLPFRKMYRLLLVTYVFECKVSRPIPTSDAVVRGVAAPSS
jgi:hypothetical protein